MGFGRRHIPASSFDDAGVAMTAAVKATAAMAATPVGRDFIGILAALRW